MMGGLRQESVDATREGDGRPARFGSVSAAGDGFAATVYVVENKDALADSIRAAVESTGLVVRAFASPEDFLMHYDPSRPGCVVVDADLPRDAGLDLLARISSTPVHVPLVAVSGTNDPHRAIQWMKAGAVDFVLKPLAEESLRQSVEQALARDRRQRRQDGRCIEAHACWQHLTPREKEIARRVAAGVGNREIAKGLGISVRTVETHRSRVMHKMKAENLAALVRQLMLARVCS